MNAGASATAIGRRQRGVTLVELLVVIALVAIIAVRLLGRTNNAGAAALRAGQVSVANLVAAARMRAMSSGQTVRLLINLSAGGVQAEARFLRYFALQVQEAGGWRTLTDATLPSGIFVVPRDPAAMAGLLPTGVDWSRSSGGGALRSTALRSNDTSYPDAEVVLAIGSAEPEKWAAIKFTATGTTANAGDLVLAVGRRLPPGEGVSPVRLVAAEQVCGLTLSVYGVATLVSDGRGF